MKKRFYRWLAKWRLIRRYEYLNEVNRILEEYKTSRIIQGGSQEFISQERKTLLALQNETSEQESLVKFLKNL